MRRQLTAAVAALFVAGGIPEALAQGVYFYPAQGQTPEQMQRDQQECTGWAYQQPGTQAPPPPSGGGAQGGEVVRGAAGGAAVGAIAGAIGGNAGKGAAIGAASGGALGLMRRGSRNRSQQQSYDAYQQQYAQAQASFNRALAACMQAKGYSAS